MTGDSNTPTNDQPTHLTDAKLYEILIEELRRLDQVAYVRFASVYRRFEDVNQFMEELKTLLMHRED